MRPCVVRRVSSGTRASREVEHHSKTSQGVLPRPQPLKMWKQFGGLYMRTVGEQLRRMLQLLMSYATVQTILTCDLNMNRVAAKFVPRFLAPEQKEHRVAICEKLLQRALNDQFFMSRVITRDESWVYGHDPETKQVFELEESRIPKTEEGEAEPQRDQKHAHRVFRH